MKTNQSGFAPMIILGVISATLVTGAGVAVASNGSKPGDALYGIDRATERIQLALSLTSGMKLNARQSIAEERLTEVKALLAEKEVDISGIENALSNFEEHRARISDDLNDDGNMDEKEIEIEREIESKKSEIDKLFEKQQGSLENQREALKKRYEAALKAGDTALAADLKKQIDGFEGILKTAEEAREEQKQAAEQQQREAEEQSEADKKAEEAQREAEKQAAEQQHEDN